MNTIRIFSKKSFAIGPGAQRGTDRIESFITVPGTFQDMPEAYVNDKTFKLAVKFHEIEIIEQKVHIPTAPVVPVEKEEEKNAVEAKINEVKNEDSSEFTSEEKFKEDLKAMNKEQVKELAGKYGVEFKDEDSLKLNKKRVFEAYKLQNNTEE